MLVKHIAKSGIINSMGNPFGQELNNCATLKNMYKDMEIGLEIADPNVKCNTGICMGVVLI